MTLSVERVEEALRLADLLARDLLPALAADWLEMRRALEFYADPDTYFAVAVIGDPPCGEFVDDFGPDNEGIERPGLRARAALAAIGQEVNQG